MEFVLGPLPLTIDALAVQSDGLKSVVTKEDEQAAMAAMFQAQTANWEETQEKMSQFVSRFSALLSYVVDPYLMNVIFVFLPLHPPASNQQCPACLF